MFTVLQRTAKFQMIAANDFTATALYPWQSELIMYNELYYQHRQNPTGILGGPRGRFTRLSWLGARDWVRKGGTSPTGEEYGEGTRLLPKKKCIFHLNGMFW